MFNIKNKEIELLKNLIGEILNKCNCEVAASEKAISKMHASDTNRKYYDVSQYVDIKCEIESSIKNLNEELEQYILEEAI